MSIHITRRSQTDLQAAVREIQVLAGFGQARREDVTRSLRSAAKRTLVGVPVDRMKGIRNGTSDQTDRFAVDARHYEAPAATGFCIDPRPLSIGITSPSSHAGKTTLSIALASSLCVDFAGAVTLVDADVETNSLAKEYGLDGRRGFADAVKGDASLADVVNHSSRMPLNVVTAGTHDVDAGRLARSERVRPIIEALKSDSRFVVVDLPATLDSVNAPSLAANCDVVVVVVHSGRTTRRELDRTLKMLRSANVAGVVINRSRSRVPHWVAKALNLAV
jgi:Mrp family chromosome partitioning ATPase